MLESKSKSVKSLLFIICFSLIASVGSFATFILIESGKKNYYPFNTKLSKVSKKLENTVRAMSYGKRKWDNNMETIVSFWHFIDKKIINADSFLLDNRLIEDNKMIPGGYISQYNDNTLIGVSGKGKVFTYTIQKDEFK